MPLVSVIIPVYNVEKYLRKCLDSICSQTLEDIEIICIDDGSTDSSHDILNEYADNDSRIRIFTQENKGPSSARNLGFDEAKGEYIYCMDSDDYLESEAFEELYNVAEETLADCVMFKLINFDNDTGEKYPSKYYDMAFLKELVGDNVFSHEDIGGNVFYITVSPPGKFFRREILKDVRFEEGIIFEDNPFLVEILLKSKRLVFLDKYLYNRRIRPDSLMTSKKNFTDYIIVSNRLIDLAKKYGCYDEYKPELFEKIFKNLFNRFNEVDDENKQEFLDKLREDFKSKKEELDADETFQNGDERLKEIFYRALDSETPKEFNLYLELFDTKVKMDEIKAEKKNIIREKNRIISEKKLLWHRCYDLSQKTNELANENRALKGE